MNVPLFLFVIFTFFFGISSANSNKCVSGLNELHIKEVFVGIAEIFERIVQELPEKIICGLEERLPKRLKQELNLESQIASIPKIMKAKMRCQIPDKQRSGLIYRCSKLLDMVNKSEVCIKPRQEREIKCMKLSIDLALVVDESGSIGAKDFKIALDACSSLVGKLTIGTRPSESRVGLVTFDHDARLRFDLNQYTTKEEIQNAILNVKQNEGLTDIGRGMNVAINQVLNVPNRPGAKKVLVVMTDGEDDGYTLQQVADLAASNNITVYAIGIGTEIKLDQLRIIAKDPNRVKMINKYEELEAELIQTICT